MEKMYQEFKDVVEFRLVYIREAHAVDSDWPMPIARKKGILEHKSYDDRCTTAKMLMDDESLTMPMLIDGMNNAANQDYSAYPDRVFLIRKDGRLAVAAKRGPWGFEPGMKAAKKWLGEFKETGEEPELSQEVIDSADAATEKRLEKQKAALITQLKKIKGNWTVDNVGENDRFQGKVSFAVEDEPASGQFASSDQTMSLDDLRFNGRQLSFSLIASEQRMEFYGEFDGEKIIGQLTDDDKVYESTWAKE